jgi:glycosyltransferase involved in cell wall biosynthesis
MNNTLRPHGATFSRGITVHPGRMFFSAIVLTYNEEHNLQRCLSELAALGVNIFVVDSGSTDGTLDIAAQYASVVHHPFETHARQWSWALANLPIPTNWVLALDADQQVTPELRTELDALFTCPDAISQEVEGIYIRRRQIFRGRWIKHGGYYPKYLLKLFRVDKVHLDATDLVDHHFYVVGPTIQLKHDLVENNVKENSISFWIEKHNRYARLLATEELQRRTLAKQDLTRPSLVGNPDQRSLWLKRAWYRCPIYGRSFLYFIYRYFLRLGFLDGKEGFIFHFMQAFWFRLLVDINLEELKRAATQRVLLQ